MICSLAKTASLVYTQACWLFKTSFGGILMGDDQMTTLHHVQDAASRIATSIIHTPMVYSPALSRLLNGQIYLKLENLQKTGSFKIRGASNKIIRQKACIGPRGVVAASAGNHAQGVALAATQEGIPATIVMPAWASISKQEGTRAYGGKVRLHGSTITHALDHANQLASKGYYLIHPFDDIDIIAGQGTLATEILVDMPNVDMIIAPIGGGGLMAGIATVIKSQKNRAQLVGVQAETCASAVAALKKGRPTEIEAQISLADGISVKKIGRLPFEIVRKHVDRVVTVADEDIADAMLTLLEQEKILAEGSGATPLAAILSGKIPVDPTSKTVLVISGGNVDMPLVGRIIDKGLMKKGRLMRIRVELPDRPGTLTRLLGLVAKQDANVLHIYHERHARGLAINASIVELELETRSFEHTQTITRELKKSHYDIEVL
jgi:threonine dehydratase